jgi:ornithine carbamoyltransferase
MPSPGVGQALPAADFVYTDVWPSMGDAKESGQSGSVCSSPTATVDSLRQTANPHAKFMHCLPAFHNVETKIGSEIAQAFGLNCMEVTEDVFEGLASTVFDKGRRSEGRRLPARPARRGERRHGRLPNRAGA